MNGIATTKGTQAVGVGGLLKWWAWDGSGVRRSVWARDKSDARRVTIIRHKFCPLRVEPASPLLDEFAESMAAGWRPECVGEGVDDDS